MRRQTPGSIAERFLYVLEGMMMKIEVSSEPMTIKDMDEAAEALAVIIIRHLTADYPPLKSERKRNNSNKENQQITKK